MEKWPEILLPLLRIRMTIAGRVSQNRQRQLLKSSGKTNLGFLMRVLHALFIALLTAFGGCILAVFNG